MHVSFPPTLSTPRFSAAKNVQKTEEGVLKQLTELMQGQKVPFPKVLQVLLNTDQISSEEYVTLKALYEMGLPRFIADRMTFPGMDGKVRTVQEGWARGHDERQRELQERGYLNEADYRFSIGQ